MGNKLRKNSEGIKGDDEGNVKLTKLQKIQNNAEQKNEARDKPSKKRDKIANIAQTKRNETKHEFSKTEQSNGNHFLENSQNQNNRNCEHKTQDAPSNESKTKLLNINKIESFAADLCNVITKNAYNTIKENGFKAYAKNLAETEKKTNTSEIVNEKKDENTNDFFQQKLITDCTIDESVPDIKERNDLSESKKESINDFKQQDECDFSPISQENESLTSVTHDCSNENGTEAIPANLKKYDEIIHKFSNELTSVILNNLFLKLKT
ncbi:uncharacterized protein LOC124810517 [Hydra vulgaris]|uniref:uncharacterized protein LOC124810517 n=1 Tax=Hydra vulgaris TaxID=6087 RepID=UPI001F5E4F42|nr:uncharacterized protein LOC124810517 [Hydra vulgaris]